MVSSGEAQGEETAALEVLPETPPLVVLVKLEQRGQLQQTVRLSSGELIVGASPECDLIVEDAAVSRRHLRLGLAPEGVFIEDLGSRNGTFFRGQRLGSASLNLGSRVQLGESTLLFEADSEDFEGTQGEAASQYGELFGASPSMRRLFTLMRRLEGSLVSVLIEGESGTGKELVARALHQNSRIASGPLFCINCGALDRGLVRSELFGHKKGAFTGAVSDTLGAFEAAHGGTLFLDEIGELPLDVQPVLLRALETGEISRIGETRVRKVRVRLIAATHRDLKQDVEDGLFRQDLYYRLRVVSLQLPPLRSRTEDIPLLARHFADRVGAGPLPDEVVEQLGRRSLPGNVRELKHLIEAYGALGELPSAEPVQVGELDEVLERALDTERPYAEQKEWIVDRMTRIYLKRLIEKTGGNRSEAARIAELQRGYLRRLLEKYDLT